MALTCVNNYLSIGKTCENRPPVNVCTTLFLTVPSFSFANANDFADRDKWVEGIVNGYIYPIQWIEGVTPEDTDGGIVETSLQTKQKTFDGKRGAMYDVILPLESHKIARTYNGKSWNVFYGYESGAIIGTKNSDGTYSGISLGLLDIKPFSTPAPDAYTATKIQLQEADINEIDIDGVYVNVDWNIKKLYGANQVITSSGSITASVFTANVYYQNQGKAGATQTAITGLLVGNFEVTDENGTVLTPTTDYTATETPADSGAYVIDASSATIAAGAKVRVIPTTAALYKSNLEVLA